MVAIVADVSDLSFKVLVIVADVSDLISPCYSCRCF